MIEKWDLNGAFPTLIVRNEGLGGSGISYIKSKAGNLVNQTVVVLYGTNDHDSWDESYPQEYINAVSSLGGREVFVISILPRSVEIYGSEINSKTKAINTDIKSLVISYGWHYIDVFDLYIKDGDMNPDYTYDGVHLNDRGYEILTYELRKVLK